MLIVCEGEKTEPAYFKGWIQRLRLTAGVVVDGAGRNTLSLVDYALTVGRRRGIPEVWCVFDKDSFSPQQFNAAVQACAAQTNRRLCTDGSKQFLHCAIWSNECFELWYVLHFQLLTAALSRTSYLPILTQHLGIPYQKNDPDLLDRLIDRTPLAVRNAEHLRARGVGTPASRSPETQVDILVQRLQYLAR